MIQFQKILCPVDLSPNSRGAIELATSLAKHYNAKLTFIYIAPQWLPTETIADSDYIRAALEYDEQAFRQIRPSDESVDFEHIFQQGNPGPEIVNAAKNCDLVVMNTHGHTGFIRLLMGSVAEYVLRHVQCPVVTSKITNANPPTSAEIAQEPSTRQANESKQQRQRFVTETMHHVRPVHDFDQMEDVIRDLQLANETAAPVIDEHGSCHGILTQTDINHYLELKKRLENRDETVIDEIFETDEFGQRRTGNSDFEQVHRHMTTGVVTIDNTETFETAAQLLSENPRIHHLVVVDHTRHPVGILDSRGSDFPMG